MTLLPPAPSPLDEVYVSLDLETTGLDPEREDIIEIGAVKFRGDEVLATFQTLVNPRRELSSFVTQLTGISQRQVDTAPPMADVAGQLLAFLGHLPLVGHNVAFDLAFLAKAGLGLANPRYDTQDMASVFLPSAEGYALTGLAGALGIPHARPHRALEDARICHHLFLALVNQALKEPPGLLAAAAAIAARSTWPLRGLLMRLEEAGTRKPGGQGSAYGLGLMGVPVAGLAERLERPRSL